MSLTALATYTPRQLQPAMDAPTGRAKINVALAPGVYAAGTVLGRISASNVADVQTITIPASTSGGTWNIYNLPGGKQLTGLAWNISLANLATALNALVGASGYAVTGTAGTSYVLTAGGGLANQPIILLAVTGSLTGGASANPTIAHTTPGVGPSGTHAAYASGNSDGTQTPTGLLEYDCTVNNDGSVILGTANDLVGMADAAAPIFIAGKFRCEDLVGLDTNAVTKLGGHVASGTTTTGLLVF